MADEQLTIAIRAVNEATRALDSARRDIKGLDDDSKRATTSSGGLGRALGGVATIASGFIVGAGLMKLPGLISGASDAASNLGESVNAVNQIFEGASPTIIAWGNENANAFGLSRRAFNEMAAPMGAVLKNLGFSQDQVADSTINLTKRAADMASVFNTSVPDALAAINSALRGESNPIERYGVSVNQTAVNLRAMADTGKKTAEALTENEKATARLAIIFEQTNAVAGDFANTSDGLANSQRIQAAQSEELAAKVGEKLMPVMLAVNKAKLAAATAIVDKLLPAMDRLGVFINGTLVPAFNEWYPKIKRVFEEAFEEAEPIITKITALFRDQLLPAIQAMADFALPKFEDAFKWLADHQEVIVAFFAAWGTFLVVTSVAGAVATVMTAIATAGGILAAVMVLLTPAMAAFGVVLAVVTSPITLIAVAIALLVAGIILAVKHWDEITAATKRFGDYLLGQFNKAVEAVGEFIGSIWQRIKDDTQSLVDSVVAAWDWMKGAWQATVDAIVAAFNFLYDHVGRFKQLVDFIVEWWTSTRDFLVDAWNIIRDIVVAAVDIIVDKVKRDFNLIATFLGTVWGVIKAAVTIAWNAVRDYIVEVVSGIYKSVEEKFNEIVEFFRPIGAKILEAIGDLGSLLFNAGKAVLQGFIDGVMAKFEELKNIGGAIGGFILDALDVAFDFHSPSHIMMEKGMLAMEGFAIGLDKGMRDLVQPQLNGIMNVAPQFVVNSSQASSAAYGGGGTIGGGGGGTNHGTIMNVFPNVTTADEVLRISATAV